MRDTQVKSDQARIEAKAALKTLAAQAAAEEQSLRQEIVSLRGDLQEIRAQYEKPPQSQSQNSATSLAERDAAPARAHLQKNPRHEFARPNHLRPGALTNLPPKLPAYTFAVRAPFDDVNLWSGIATETVTAAPPWAVSAPLPLSFVDAEQLARAELRRFVQDEPQWALHEISLQRLWNSPAHWFYVIRFKHPTPFSRDFTVLLSLAGAPGLITLD